MPETKARACTKDRPHHCIAPALPLTHLAADAIQAEAHKLDVLKLDPEKADPKMGVVGMEHGLVYHASPDGCRLGCASAATAATLLAVMVGPLTICAVCHTVSCLSRCDRSDPEHAIRLGYCQTALLRRDGATEHPARWG